MTASVLSLPASHRSMARGRMADKAAIEAIRKGFSVHFLHDRFKRQLRRFIRLGTGHPEVRARYGARAAMLDGRPLEVAIVMVERWYRAERMAFQLASTYGFARGRQSLQVLAELRVLLRLLRRDSLRDHLPGIIEAVA